MSLNINYKMQGEFIYFRISQRLSVKSKSDYKNRIVNQYALISFKSRIVKTKSRLK